MAVIATFTRTFTRRSLPSPCNEQSPSHEEMSILTFESVPHRVKSRSTRQHESLVSAADRESWRAKQRLTPETSPYGNNSSGPSSLLLEINRCQWIVYSTSSTLLPHLDTMRESSNVFYQRPFSSDSLCAGYQLGEWDHQVFGASFGVRFEEPQSPLLG